MALKSLALKSLALTVQNKHFNSYLKRKPMRSFVYQKESYDYKKNNKHSIGKWQKEVWKNKTSKKDHNFEQKSENFWKTLGIKVIKSIIKKQPRTRQFFDSGLIIMDLSLFGKTYKLTEMKLKMIDVQVFCQNNFATSTTIRYAHSKHHTGSLYLL